MGLLQHSDGARRRREKLQILDTATPDDVKERCHTDGFCWLDLEHPSHDTLHGVAEALSLHPLAVEDTEEFDQRPKVNVHTDQLLLVFFTLEIDSREVPRLIEVHVHVSRSFILTIHRLACPPLARMREQFQAEPPENEQMLIYRIIDGLTDAVLEGLEVLAARVNEYQSVRLTRLRAADRDAMADLHRRLDGLRRVMVIQRQMLEAVVKRIGELPAVAEDLQPYFDDVGDHLWRAVDEIEAARGTLNDMLARYTNSVQERLTIVATVFLPLTLVTSFFGQNFGWMINKIGPTAAFWGLGIGGLILSCLVIVGWLVRSGLVNPPGRRRPTRTVARDRSESEGSA